MKSIVDIVSVVVLEFDLQLVASVYLLRVIKTRN